MAPLNHPLQPQTLVDCAPPRDSVPVRGQLPQGTLAQECPPSQQSYHHEMHWARSHGIIAICRYSGNAQNLFQKLTSWPGTNPADTQDHPTYLRRNAASDASSKCLMCQRIGLPKHPWLKGTTHEYYTSLKRSSTAAVGPEPVPYYDEQRPLSEDDARFIIMIYGKTCLTCTFYFISHVHLSRTRVLLLLGTFYKEKGRFRIAHAKLFGFLVLHRIIKGLALFQALKFNHHGATALANAICICEDTSVFGSFDDPFAVIFVDQFHHAFLLRHKGLQIGHLEVCNQISLGHGGCSSRWWSWSLL